MDCKEYSMLNIATNFYRLVKEENKKMIGAVL